MVAVCTQLLTALLDATPHWLEAMPMLQLGGEAVEARTQLEVAWFQCRMGTGMA